MPKTDIFDVTIVGAGIVGLSTAWQLMCQYPDKKILLLEKEKDFGVHQTGHNSGVIHAGVYYMPGSLKAQFCKEGAALTKQFCRQHQIDFDECGKLLVATTSVELERMQALAQRCLENEIDIEVLTQKELQVREPNIKGLGAIFVPSTGIVNYQHICTKLAELFTAAGGTVLTNTEVMSMEELTSHIRVDVSDGPILTRYLVSCSGLMADRMTRMLGIKTDFRIIPFRGEYYRLADKHKQIVNHLIYPIPDPELPFLGVHLTRMIDGSVTVGPNAVQGWKREGYNAINFSLKDTTDMLLFSGYWKLISRYWRTGLKETRNSWWKAGYLAQVNKYCHHIEQEDMLPYPAGVRAQAVMKDGSLVHDFLFATSKRSLHVCNAPSPAATSAFPIGRYIIEALEEIMIRID